MGNQRQQGKKNANVWFNEAEQSLVDALKGELNLNRSDVIKVAIRRLADPARDLADIIKEVLDEKKGESK